MGRIQQYWTCKTYTHQYYIAFLMCTYRDKYIVVPFFQCLSLNHNFYKMAMAVINFTFQKLREY